MPKYIYYSNYGNLDSQIYLSRVVTELNRKDLTQKEAAKVRTLKTLFDFVGLNSEEISNLGTETQSVISDEIERTVAVYAQMHNKDYSYAVETVVLSTILFIITMPAIVSIGEMVWR